MCWVRQFRFREDCALLCCSQRGVGLYSPTFSVFLPLPGRGPSFQHFDTYSPPRGGGEVWACTRWLGHCCFSLSLARAPIPPAPIWDQSATWDHRLGHSGDPKLLLSWDEATPVPSDWVGWRCLNRKGTSATTCRGSASLWACAMGVGIRRSQGLRSLVAAAHALTPGLHTDCFEL